MPSLHTVPAAGSLGAFQDAVFRALFDPAAEFAEGIPEVAAKPAFAMYRNTAMKGCIDALQANFPAVARLTGEEWFRVAASIYVRLCPPRTPVLLEYGRSYPDFLGALPADAAAWPCLAEVARLDRLWTEAHIAMSEPALEPAAVARLSIEDLAAAVLKPHAATRWAWSATGPARSLWSRSRAEPGEGALPEWRPEGTLTVRPRDAVHWHAIDSAGVAFLEACARGATVAMSAEAALAAEPEADLRELMALLLGAGAFAAIQLADRSPR